MNLQSTDPEYTQRLGAFLEEVRNEPDSMLESTTRWLAILATLTGNGSVDAYKEALPQALQEGLDPVAVKEMVYQATDYLGYGRTLPFLHATNDALTAAGIALPLPGQATTTMNDRLEKGIAAQVKIFGEHMNEAWKAGTVNRYLAANCFGDYYTRTGLDLAQREMITFCFLSAQGGCEPLFCDFYYSDVWKISILLCIIQSVSNYELIRNLKSCPVYVHIFHTAVWFIKQCAKTETCRLSLTKYVHQIIQCITGINDIFHDQYFLILNRLIQILRKSYNTTGLCSVAIASNTHKVHRYRNCNSLCKFAHKEYSTFQNTDQMDLLSFILFTDLFSEFTDSCIYFFL